MRRLNGTIDFKTDIVSFPPEEENHARVIRIQKGEKIEVVFNNKAYRAEISSSFPLKAKILSSQAEQSRELPFTSILLCPLLKKDNFEFALQKGTELGVNVFVPYLSSRVIKRISKEEFEERRERFMKIIFEAVEQSNRTSLPVLSPLMNYEEAIKTPGDYKFFAYEEEALKGQKIPPLKRTPSLKVVSLVGPEGGFSPEEAKKALDNGFLPVQLGKRILRAETAIISLLAVVDYLGEE
ncbi:MAG: 16S rRNA (uracil(1498)-N(3))-methyltransferase [Bacilli bacterium]|jgi:16S rRNA (uracil1498-N3)-methyltransferase|nr:16S rRNA (uracil(1498)-N(3))-methyltransferase [Bacilli bacterium]